MAEGDGEVRWDGLCSRDASARGGALENIKQLVLKKSEAMALDQGSASPPAAERLLPSGNSAPGELNQMLARLLTLSKRCPFRDVREKTEAILKHVQVKGCFIPSVLHDSWLSCLSDFWHKNMQALMGFGVAVIKQNNDLVENVTES